jgi:RNA polymerase sigma factor (sigma-70 family)
VSTIINVTDHLGLAHLACKPYKNAVGRGFDYDDLFQAACEGLMRAAETYEQSRGKFSTYAVPLAKKYVKRLVATQARTVKVPQYVQDEAAKASRPKPAPPAKTRARRTSGGAFDWSAPGASVLGPGGDDLARVSVTTGAFHSNQVFAYQGEPSSWARGADHEVHPPTAEWSFDAPTGEDGGGTLHDVLSEDGAPDPESLALAHEFADESRLKKLVATELNRDQAFVIRSRLGGSTQPEIAAFLGVSKQRVGQIQEEAVAKLRDLVLRSAPC